MPQAKVESVAAAERAQQAAVGPLRAEVARLQERVGGLQAQYTEEVAGIQGAASQQARVEGADARHCRRGWADAVGNEWGLVAALHQGGRGRWRFS